MKFNSKVYIVVWNNGTDDFVDTVFSTKWMAEQYVKNKNEKILNDNYIWYWKEEKIQDIIEI